MRLKSLHKSALHRIGGASSGRGDRLLVLAIGILTLFGLLMVYDSSIAIAVRDFGDPYHYVLEQAKWVFGGIVLFTIVSRIPFAQWKRLAVPMLIGTIVLLIAVFLPGIGIRAYGANRWVNFGFFVVQPAEFAKLALIIYLSTWFSTPEKGRFVAFLILLGMLVGLIILEPDLGTATILTVIAVSLYYYSGGPIKHFLLLIPALLAGVGLLAVTSPYRVARLLTFLNPEHDPLGASYQIRQALLALGSGGWTGLGVGQSRQKYEYLPEANTDAIFAIIGEEVGFLGATLVIVLYLFIVWRMFRIAKNAPDTFSKLVVLGVATWFGIQSSVNIAAITALLPLTGVPLPLVSNGGSSLMIFFIAFGIVHNISKQRGSA